MGTNWFKRHLNWTWVIVALACMVAFSIFWAIIGGDTSVAKNAALWVLLPAHANTLRMKKRSGWWILICFWIFFLPLCLSNNNIKEEFNNGDIK